MPQTFTARRLYTATESVEYPVLTIEDGCLVGIEAGPANDSEELLLPAFFDIHVHGAASFDFMRANAAEIDAVGRFLATKGVAFYLPTTLTGPLDTTLRALETLATAIHRQTPPDVAKPLGINLEGPFLCPAKRGAHPLDQLRAPSIELLSRFQEAAAGQIRLITIAPEMPGALEVIAYAAAQGIRVSLGHSNATAAQTEAAIAAGAVSATHTFNAMRALDHREPGIAGTVLDRDDLFAEAIVDGVHVHPALVRLWFRSKGADRAILITDGMSATGMGDGTFMLGDLSVEVRDGVCLSNGVLAGSVLTLDRAVANLREITGTALPVAVRLASRNPARMLGLEREVECVVGTAANFNIYDEAGKRRGSLLHGRRLPA